MAGEDVSEVGIRSIRVAVFLDCISLLHFPEAWFNCTHMFQNIIQPGECLLWHSCHGIETSVAPSKVAEMFYQQHWHRRHWYWQTGAARSLIGQGCSGRLDSNVGELLVTYCR